MPCHVRSSTSVRARRRSAALLALFLPALAAAQGAQGPIPIQLPKSLVFPNYDNVHLGKDQALEGGAYIARVGDASANFYNPAGLVQSDRSAVNASSTGWVWTKLSSEALNRSVTSSKIDNVPGYVGVVIGSPFIRSRNVRVGLSLTRLASWSPGGLDFTSTPTGVEGLDRLTHSATSNFYTTLIQGAVAWAPGGDRSLRLGASFGVADTSFSSTGTLSGVITTGGSSGQFLSTLRANGEEWDLVFGAGVQWDVSARLRVGALVRSPGLRIASGSLVTYESSVLAATLPPQTSFFRDDTGAFQYKLPLEASVGIACDFGHAQVEADVRYHDSVATYDFYRTNVPLQITTLSAGTTSVTTQPLPPFQYSARRVVNVSVGGNYKLGQHATLHGGLYASMSPVAHPDTSPLRQADLYGITGGVDFQLEHLGASIGAGYEWGSSPSTPVGVGGQVIQGANGVRLQSISIQYAISYSF
jgi:hypothetical protein